MGGAPVADAEAGGAQVLSALPAAEPLYAVLDGARDRHIRGFALDSHAPCWCLYRGELPAALENAAPWLLRLTPGSAYTEEFFARGWNDCWGIVFTSTAPSRELRCHLRRFLLARTEAGRKLLFRYYDPRVLRIYLPTCTPAELATFFGPISAFAAPGEKPGTVELFRAPEPAGRAAATSRATPSFEEPPRTLAG
jgi:hypothetical protein